MAPRQPEEQREFTAWLERKLRDTNRADGQPMRQSDLAEAIGVGAPFVSQILNGKRIAGAELVIRIANLFEEDANKLLNLARYETISDQPDVDRDDPDVLRVFAAIRVLLRDRGKLQSAVSMLEGLANDVRKSRKGNLDNDSAVRKRPG